ncbi:MAG: hypothetical protein CMJ83_17790 [Planctomycetes bacterium]|nr:hypothetical protein [Planctomycetota bacterium]
MTDESPHLASLPDPGDDGTSFVWVDRLKREPHAETVWASLEKRYLMRLKVYASQQLGPKLRRQCEPEDIISEAWMRAVSKIDRFEYRRKGSFLDWLQQQIRWVILDRVRQQDRRPPPAAALPADSNPENPVGPDPSAQGPGPATEVSRKDLKARLVESLESLPEIYRAVLVHHCLESKSVQEIAEETGRKANTVSQQLKRGLELWRRTFGGDPMSYV